MYSTTVGIDAFSGAVWKCRQMATVWHGPGVDSNKTDQQKQTIVFRIRW